MHRLPVKIEKIEKQRKITGLIHVVAGVYLAAISGSLFERSFLPWFMSVFLLIASGCIAYGFLRKKMDAGGRWNAFIRWVETIAFAILSILLLANNEGVNAYFVCAWTMISAYLLMSEKNIFKHTDISLENEGVVLPGSFGNRKVLWNDIENFIARPDFVTITQHDNTYMQLEVSEQLDPFVLQQANDFSKQKIASKANS